MTSPKPSLRARLARHVLLPLVLATGLGTTLSTAVAEHFAAQAFDRSLLDDAYALASHVRREDGHLAIALTQREIATLLFDQAESMYFAVLAPDGALLAGHAGLRPGPLAAPGGYEFDNASFEGKLLRTVTLHRETPQEFLVVMGQTTSSRNRLLRRLLMYSALPQVALLVALAWWLRRRIGGDLRPLGELQRAIDRRDANDLAPLPPALNAEASTREVERIATALDSLLARLQQSLDAQREFAGNVAHELRTPLAGIRAQASFALASDDPAVWREQLDGIALAEQRASRLVGQLLALARADEGGASVQLEALRLDELAREVLLRFLARADAAGIDLGGEGLDQPVVVRGDRGLIEGMLNNLLDNALRYGADTPAPRVTVEVRRSNEGGVSLCVRDNGPGLPAGQAAKLRKRWSQGPAGQKLGQGAGLGLSIVDRYAELLGARFTLARTEGGGLCACIHFARSPDLPAA